MTQPDLESPSPFITEWIAASAGSLPRRRALDVAMGRGRHARALVEQGFDVFGVDVDVAKLRAAVVALGLGASLKVWCADLTSFPLPRERFELVLVTRYLQRDLFPSIGDALVPGGFVLYETFTVRQRAFGVGPTSPDHLLQEGELIARFEGFEIVFYEEAVDREAVARIVARKP